MSPVNISLLHFAQLTFDRTYYLWCYTCSSPCLTHYRSPTSGEVTGLEGRLALEDTNYRNTPKLTWLAVDALPEGEHTPTTLLHFDVLIKKPVLKPDDNWKEYVNYDSKACWVHIYWCSA